MGHQKQKWEAELEVAREGFERQLEQAEGARSASEVGLKQRIDMVVNEGEQEVDRLKKEMAEREKKLVQEHAERVEEHEKMLKTQEEEVRRLEENLEKTREEYSVRSGEVSELKFELDRKGVVETELAEKMENLKQEFCKKEEETELRWKERVKGREKELVEQKEAEVRGVRNE